MTRAVSCGSTGWPKAASAGSFGPAVDRPVGPWSIQNVRHPRSIRGNVPIDSQDRAGARLRLWLTAAVILVMTGAAAVVGVLAGRNSARLEIVDARLRDTGRFAEARARLQRRAFELLPITLPGESVLVGDILLQIEQAASLGDRLPAEVRTTLGQLRLALSRPTVRRDDIVVAASLLETIVDAESVVQERIFADAVAAIRYERNVTLAGLFVLTALSLLGVWTVPRAASLRAFVRFWLKGVLEHRKSLLRAERLALAGEAAAGLAHELRNPLAGVTLGLQNLERDEEELSPRIRPLVSELERVTRTLNEHLGALRTPPESPTTIQVDLLVSDLVELLRYEASPGVVVAADVPSGLRCRTQQDRLRQVLLNLGLNGLQAMEGNRGTLRFEARVEDQNLLVSVTDTGPGFPDHILRGTAGPFSSSKPGGMGLGLRLVRRLVGEMGGTVSLENRHEGGASVTLRIPSPEAAT